jgi:hypothetical protein
MPNAFAYLVLLSWPLVALALFRSMPVYKALVWTIVGGHLLMPSGTYIKFPMLPALDKASVAAGSALVFCMIFSPRISPAPEASARIGRHTILILLGIVIVTPILTVLQNTEPLVYGPTFLPGLRLYDGFGLISQVIVAMVPFWLGLRYLNTHDGHKTLLQALAISAVCYSFPALVEIRLSPQLHTWVYGFFPHDFIQHIRAGGFRPLVFLNHGLMLGIFLCMAIISAVVLYCEARREEKPAFGWLMVALWLFVVLFFSKNLGALMICAAISFVAFALGRRLQITLAVVVAAVVMFYPLLRGAGWIPVETVHNIALSIDVERAASLKFRLDNEDTLLTHANRKPFSGWGSWGRHAIFSPEDGRMTSTTDGIWLVLIGIYGWFGYIGRFGLLTLPILLFALRRSRFGPSLITPGVILLLSANLIDFLPNAGLVNYVWLMAGAIAGYVVWRPEKSTAAPAGRPASAQTALPIEGLPAETRASWLMNETRTMPARRRRAVSGKGRTS